MTSHHDSHTTTDVKLEMEFHMINMIYAVLPMRAQIEKITFCFAVFFACRSVFHQWTRGGQNKKLVLDGCITDPPNLLGPKRVNLSKNYQKKLYSLVLNGPNFDNLKSATLEPTSKWLKKGLKWSITSVWYIQVDQPRVGLKWGYIFTHHLPGTLKRRIRLWFCM